MKSSSPPQLTPEHAQRFWTHVRKTEDCWHWTGSLDRDGYGRFKMLGKRYRAHRVALILAGQTLLPDLVVDHLCKTPGCVRPDHLEQITQGDNVRRGGVVGHQWHRGEDQHRACLTADIVRAIRTSSAPTSELARLYGVSYQSVSDARAGRTWKHLDSPSHK